VCIREALGGRMGCAGMNEKPDHETTPAVQCYLSMSQYSRQSSLFDFNWNGKWEMGIEERRRAVKHNGNHNASPIWGPISISHMHIEHLVSAIDVGGCVCFSPTQRGPNFVYISLFLPEKFESFMTSTEEKLQNFQFINLTDF